VLYVVFCVFNIIWRVMLSFPSGVTIKTFDSASWQACNPLTIAVSCMIAASNTLGMEGIQGNGMACHLKRGVEKASECWFRSWHLSGSSL